MYRTNRIIRTRWPKLVKNNVVHSWFSAFNLLLITVITYIYWVVFPDLLGTAFNSVIACNWPSVESKTYFVKSLALISKTLPPETKQTPKMSLIPPPLGVRRKVQPKMHAFQNHLLVIRKGAPLQALRGPSSRRGQCEVHFTEHRVPFPGKRCFPVVQSLGCQGRPMGWGWSASCLSAYHPETRLRIMEKEAIALKFTLRR